MDNVSEMNFKAIQDALNTLNKKWEGQEKRINSHIQTQQMMMETIQRLQQEIAILKVVNLGSGPTV